MFTGGSVRIGHVTGSSHVPLYDFSNYMIILTIIPYMSIMAIKCSYFSLLVP